ncbi:peptide deformylase [Chitinophaga sp. 22620]|uniref:peptide deformylase n=1 Tax=Chitinophaga sp. 22620 TaxID=3453952 RepID=UPI003F874A83
MKMPILSYGHSLLRQMCADVQPDHPGLERFINDLWETMQHANGCGLAAPQAGKALRIFVADSLSTFNSLDGRSREYYFHPGDGGIKETFINARIIRRFGRSWGDEEGCLSIPGIAETVQRPWSVTIAYLDRQLSPRRQTFHGMTARIIQHEYDHVDGILFLDHLDALTRKILAGKLKKIVKGQVKTKYRMIFP